MSARTIRAVRALGGHIQLELRLENMTCQIIAFLQEQEAIELCDQLRFALEEPALREPIGENVVVMKTKTA